MHEYIAPFLTSAASLGVSDFFDQLIEKVRDRPEPSIPDRSKPSGPSGTVQSGPSETVQGRIVG